MSGALGLGKVVVCFAPPFVSSPAEGVYGRVTVLSKEWESMGGLYSVLQVSGPAAGI